MSILNLIHSTVVKQQFKQSWRFKVILKNEWKRKGD